jgi:uncharacterized RDD family membrane protein YckC
MAPDTYTSHATHRMVELEGLRLAPFGRRLAAFALDFLIVVVLFALLVIAGAKLADKLHLLPQDTHAHLEFDFHHWYSLLALVLYFGLGTYFGNGQTPGKRLLRLRVVSTLHPRLSLWHALERALGYGASALELGFGFLQYFIADNRQTVHDRIAGTIVVVEPMRTADPS